MYHNGKFTKIHAGQVSKIDDIWRYGRWPI